MPATRFLLTKKWEVYTKGSGPLLPSSVDFYIFLGLTTIRTSSFITAYKKSHFSGRREFHITRTVQYRLHHVDSAEKTP